MKVALKIKFIVLIRKDGSKSAPVLHYFCTKASRWKPVEVLELKESEYQDFLWKAGGCY